MTGVDVSAEQVRAPETGAESQVRPSGLTGLELEPESFDALSRSMRSTTSRASARADVRADSPLACPVRSADDGAWNERYGRLDRGLAWCTDVLLELPTRDEHAARAGGRLQDPSRRARYLPRAGWRRDLPVGTGHAVSRRRQCAFASVRECHISGESAQLTRSPKC